MTNDDRRGTYWRWRTYTYMYAHRGQYSERNMLPPKQCEMCRWKPEDTGADPFTCLRLVYTKRDTERRPRPPGWCGHPHNAHWVCESRHTKETPASSPPDFSGATSPCPAREDKEYVRDKAFAALQTLPTAATRVAVSTCHIYCEHTSTVGGGQQMTPPASHELWHLRDDSRNLQWCTHKGRTWLQLKGLAVFADTSVCCTVSRGGAEAPPATAVWHDKLPPSVFVCVGGGGGDAPPTAHVAFARTGCHDRSLTRSRCAAKQHCVLLAADDSDVELHVDAHDVYELYAPSPLGALHSRAALDNRPGTLARLLPRAAAQDAHNALLRNIDTKHGCLLVRAPGPVRTTQEQ